LFIVIFNAIICCSAYTVYHNLMTVGSGCDHI